MAVTVREVLRDMMDAGTVELETGAGTLATDVLALVQFVDAAGIATPTPGTWTGPVGAVANGVRTAIHYRVVGGAGGATAVDANISGSPSNHAHLLVLAGADLPHTDVDTASGFDDTQTVPSQTGDDGGLQICGWVSDDSVTYTAPGSMTGGGQTQNNGFSTGFTAYEALTADGATGTKAATVGSGKTFVAVGVTFPPAAAGGAVTGTVAVTEQADTLAASGTATPPPIAGTLAQTEAADILTAAGTHVAPIFTGTLAVTEAADELAATGTHTPPVFTGTMAATEADDTLAAVGTAAAPVFSGTAAITEAADVLAAAGTVVNDAIVGTLAVTEQDDTLAAAGTFTAAAGVVDITVTVGDLRAALMAVGTMRDAAAATVADMAAAGSVGDMRATITVGDMRE